MRMRVVGEGELSGLDEAAQRGGGCGWGGASEYKRRLVAKKLDGGP